MTALAVLSVARVFIFAGAGVSAEIGIPAFRGMAEPGAVARLGVIIE
jgi:NAD-dependent SIR2 family protein deacetylase